MRRLQTQVHVSRRRPAAALAVAFAIGVVALEPGGADATAVQPAEFGVYPLPANFSMYEPEGLRQSCLFHGLPEHCGGEPSIGVDVSTNTAMAQMMLTTARIRWDDSQQPPAATWTNVSYTGFDWTGDPDGSTDRATGRTFNVQLCPSVACNPTPGTRRVGIASTDDDGASWNQPSEVVSPYADKPVIGSGPYHSPAPAAASYPSAVYLCAGDDSTGRAATRTATAATTAGTRGDRQRWRARGQARVCHSRERSRSMVTGSSICRSSTAAAGRGWRPAATMARRGA